jgi:hypothetical protein
VNPLVVVDFSSLVLGFVFLGLTLMIRRNVRIPQNNVLLIVGVLLLLFLFVHLCEYFPDLLPQIDEETSHHVMDATLFLTVFSLAWYGVTTYGYVRKTK